MNDSAKLMPTGNACYEAWINLDSSKPSPAILSSGTGASAYGAALVVRDDQGEVRFGAQNGGPLLTARFKVNPHDGQWHHIAGCTQVELLSVTLTLFWDGGLKDTVTGTKAQIGPMADVRLGSLAYAPTDGLGGYIDEVRISSTIRYTGDFQPSPQCLASDADTVLSLHFDVSSGTFQDSSANGRSVSPLGAATPASVCP